MAQDLKSWVETSVKKVEELPRKRVVEEYFFRDPIRPLYCDNRYFFAPADGVIVYQALVGPDQPVVNLKGTTYTLRNALRDLGYSCRSLVVGIFMTQYDVHVNRIPYSGRLTYRWLPPLETRNYPMLEVEERLLEDLEVSLEKGEYLHHNERVVNRIFAPDLRLAYNVVQLADYDVRCITPFELRQNRPVAQNQRFSQIRFGSQVDLVVPLSPRFDLETLLPVGTHVEAGLDPLVRIVFHSGAEAESRGASHVTSERL